MLYTEHVTVSSKEPAKRCKDFHVPSSKLINRLNPEELISHILQKSSANKTNEIAVLIKKKRSLYRTFFS